MKKSVALLTTATTIIGITAALLSSTASASGYLQNELIDDPIYLNAGSMSAGQIETFLSGKGSYLANYSVAETDSYFAHYGSTVPAAQVIYDGAQAYGINPQVILATLQKEEGLVTDASPQQSQLDFAMGYGCADSTGCGAYSGFFNQIDNATWQLRFNFERARGNNSWWNSSTSYLCANGTRYYNPGLFPNNSVTFYDDYGTAYDTFTILNASTASLYCYTPHAYPGSTAEYYSGSYNFVVDFNQWFGSPLASYSLVKASNSATIYLLDGPTETVYSLPNYSVIQMLGLSTQSVVIMDPTALSGFTNGGTLSTLIRQSTGTLYLVESGRRYAISSSQQCTDWGLSCFNSSVVMTLSDAFINSLVNGGNLPALQDNNGTVYLMQNGNRDPVLSPQELTDLGYNWADVTSMSDVNSTQPLGPLLVPNGTTIKYPTSDTIYLYDNDAYHPITNGSLINAWGLAKDLVANPPPSSYSTSMPTTGTSLSSIYGTDGTHTYVADGTQKIDVTSNPTDWNASSPQNFLNSTLSSLPTVSSSPAIRASDGGIYKVSAGQKLWIPSVQDFSALGYQPSQLLNISSYTATQLATAGPDLADGSLYRVSDGTIYLVNGNSSVPLPSPLYFNLFDLDSSILLNLDSSTLSTYPTASPLSDLIKNPNGQYFVASNGSFYGLSSQLLTNWGVTTLGATPLTTQNFARLPSNIAMTNFARTPDGTIYYGNSGAAHKINSYQTYLSLGGNSTNTINVDTSFINSCASGSSL